MELCFRLVEKRDCRLIYDWFTDPITRNNSYSNEIVAYERHEVWFDTRITREQEPFLVFYIKDNPEQMLGMVRIDQNSEGPVIGINIAPEHRGKGYAVEMLQLALSYFYQLHPDSPPVRAWIMKHNAASRQTFVTAGFAKQYDECKSGIPSSLYIHKNE
jgi:RimJ/RimL family protein N-acetyltransferase